MEKNNTFSNNLRKIMLKKGFRVKELSDNTGVARSTLYKWLDGSAVPTQYNIQSLCNVLGCSREDLFSEKESFSDLFLNQETTDFLFHFSDPGTKQNPYSASNYSATNNKTEEVVINKDKPQNNVSPNLYIPSLVKEFMQLTDAEKWEIFWLMRNMNAKKTQDHSIQYDVPQTMDAITGLKKPAIKPETEESKNE